MKKVEITEEQYSSLKGLKGVNVVAEKRYFLMAGAAGVKPKSSPKNRRQPTALLKLSGKAVDGVTMTDDQAKALKLAVGILGKNTMQSRVLSDRLADAMRLSKDMGSYYVSALIKKGAIVEA